MQSRLRHDSSFTATVGSLPPAITSTTREPTPQFQNKTPAFHQSSPRGRICRLSTSITSLIRVNSALLGFNRDGRSPLNQRSNLENLGPNSQVPPRFLGSFSVKAFTGNDLFPSLKRRIPGVCALKVHLVCNFFSILHISASRIETPVIVICTLPCRFGSQS